MKTTLMFVSKFVFHAITRKSVASASAANNNKAMSYAIVMIKAKETERHPLDSRFQAEERHVDDSHSRGTSV
jgi:hypothetical protein